MDHEAEAARGEVTCRIVHGFIVVDMRTLPGILNSVLTTCIVSVIFILVYLPA